MNESRIFVDTNILLYLIKKDDYLSNLLQNKDLFISIVTEIELLSYHGITLAEQKKIQELINDCIIIDLNQNVKNIAIDLRRRYRLKLSDSIVAASSLFINLPLITADSDFQKVKEINLQLYQK